MWEFFSVFASVEAWVALGALVTMEIVLGIDNLIFISILTNKLPEPMRAPARRIGIALALVLRLALLALVAVIVRLTQPLFVVFDHPLSVRDLILIGGGLFLVWKATTEIHHSLDRAAPAEAGAGTPRAAFGSTVLQIVGLDLVFSIDSIVTAVGMTTHVPVMILSVLAAVGVMMTAAGPLSRFIAAHPSVVMLALAFLFMIGMTLIADGLGQHVPKGYIYAAMGFSIAVEALNLAARRRQSRRQRPAPAPRLRAEES